jgi:hypothetical protein
MAIVINITCFKINISIILIALSDGGFAECWQNRGNHFEIAGQFYNYESVKMGAIRISDPCNDESLYPAAIGLKATPGR